MIMRSSVGHRCGAQATSDEVNYRDSLQVHKTRFGNGMTVIHFENLPGRHPSCSVACRPASPDERGQNARTIPTDAVIDIDLMIMELSINPSLVLWHFSIRLRPSAGSAFMPFVSSSVNAINVRPNVKERLI